MFAYVNRYPGCNRAILVYSWAEDTIETPKIVSFILEGNEKRVDVARINMMTDLSTHDGRDKLKKELKTILKEKNNGHKRD